MDSSGESNSLPLVLGAAGLSLLVIGYVMLAPDLVPAPDPHPTRIAERVIQRSRMRPRAIQRTRKIVVRAKPLPPPRAIQKKPKTKPLPPPPPATPTVSVSSWRINWYRGEKQLRDKVIIKKEESEAVAVAKAGIPGADRWTLKDMYVNKIVQQGKVAQ